MGAVAEGSRNLTISSQQVAAIPDGPKECTGDEQESGPVGWVLVSVKDSGPGLDPQALDRLFEAFYTTKPQGLGMGLAISHSIIAAHGGRLWATANIPEGAVFKFALPIEPDPAG